MGTVKEMLKNVAYIGTCVFGKLQTGRFNWAGRKTHEAVRSLKQQIADLDRKIARGAERLLLLDGEDLPDASAALSDWRTTQMAVRAGRHPLR